LDSEAITMMADEGTFYVPTLSVTQKPRDEYERAQWNNFVIDKAVRAARAHREAFQKTLAAGVRIASGEDSGLIAEHAIREIELLVEAGMTPWQALLSATRTAAEVTGVGQDLGTLEPGKLADLLILGQNPLEDIRALRHPLLVMKGGAVVVSNAQMIESDRANVVRLMVTSQICS
jgi:imidazolonepropionase-like amidohydrolase